MEKIHWRFCVGACFLALLGRGFASALDKDAPPVRTGLAAFLKGELPGDKVIITYTDLHGLHGGLRLTIHGTGKVEQEAVRIEAGEPHDVTREDFEALVRLLIEREAWQQKVPERSPVPDESRASLTIVVGEEKSTIWEWYNDMKANDRLIRIREKMTAIAWQK
ncbi:MAG: hypothetical protein AB1696_12375 [Planctomycetota bacterium]